MALPKISIVTPSFNQASYIRETIESVLSQGYPNLQYVIIDGSSDDGSVDIIREYQDQLHYWVSEKDRGHADAVNKGFAKTDGEIMAWINSDDKYAAAAFHAVAEIFSKFPEVEWIIGYNSIWDSHGNMVSSSHGQKNIYDYLNGNYRWIQQESVFWRRSLWEKAGGHVSENYMMMDGELWSRFFLHAELFSVDQILGGFRYHGENRSAQFKARCLKEMEAIIGELKEKVPAKVNKTAARLKQIERFRLAALLGQPLIDRLIDIEDMPSCYQSIHYRNIFSEDNEWKIRSI